MVVVNRLSTCRVYMHFQLSHACAYSPHETTPNHITPEAEIWRWVDAPALLGDEDLGVSDLVNIFQLEVEEMLSSYSAAVGGV